MKATPSSSNPYSHLTAEDIKIETLESELRFVANMVPNDPDTVNEFIGTNFEEYHHSVDEFTFAKDDKIVMTVGDLIECFQRWKEDTIYDIVWDDSAEGTKDE